MEAQIRLHNEIDRLEWEAFILSSPQGNCFVRPDYMDLIAPGWRAIEVRDQGVLQAVLPLNWRTKGGFNASLQPSFAQCWGLLLAVPPPGNAYTVYSWKRKVVTAAIAGLPAKLHWFVHGFSPEFDYGVPFHWAGYTLHTRYTYRLSLDGTEAQLLAGLQKDRQRYVRQAPDKGPAVRSGSTAELMALAAVNKDKDVLGGQTLAFTARLFDWLLADGSGQIWVAEQEGQVIAGGMFIRYGKQTTYLFGVQNPALKSPSAMTLVLWEAMRQGIGPGRRFDFEGSMIEGIESFFRGLGGSPVPYLYIQKNRLPLWVRWIRNLQ
jgi:hypothetical protein